MPSLLIQFLVPLPQDHSDPLPTSAAGYWPWISSQSQIDAWGPFSWTLQTYLYLKQAGVDCRLVHEPPTSGVVIAHRDFIPGDLKPGKDLYLACILADREQAGFVGHHQWAQFHVVQNPLDRKLTNAAPDWPAAFVPYWPQPGLLPRDASRGDRVETVAFFGYRHNLSPELQTDDWSAKLRALGLNWQVPHRSAWHDYGVVDAVVAVRPFGESPAFEYKPPSKLHNAWRAGVPAILGIETAYRAWRTSELDYIEVRSANEALDALERLRDEPGLRRAMVENGLQRAQEVSTERIVDSWKQLLADLDARWRAWAGLTDEARESFLRRRRITARVNIHGIGGQTTIEDEVDLIVLGTGFAAYELTRTFLAKGKSVAVLERGGETIADQPAAMSAVSFRREPIQSGGLAFGSRVPADFESLPRFVGLGGSSVLWSGKWRRLDRLDVERPYGDRRWPLPYDELQLWYNEIGRDYGCPAWSEESVDAEFRAKAAECSLRLIEIFDQDPPLQLSERWTDFGADRVRIHYHAERVTPLHGDSGAHIEGVTVRTGGKNVAIGARSVVVACGGIASVPVSHGLRSRDGRAERYGGFMDHPKAIVGSVTPRSGSGFVEYLEQQRIRHRRLLAISLPEEEIVARGFGNHAAFLWSTEEGAMAPLRLTLSLEQFPEPDNAVFSVDPPTVSWRVSSSTRRDADAFLRELTPRLEKLIGPVRQSDELAWRGASHHVGALPMGENGQSIVDATGRFHEMENLYCMSSALFPVAGSANPTLTIVALARRMATQLAASGQT